MKRLALFFIFVLILSGIFPQTALCAQPLPPTSVPKPDVFLITIDTLRADHVACYGYKQIETPTIDAISADGVRFTHAFTHSPITTRLTPPSSPACCPASTASPISEFPSLLSTSPGLNCSKNRDIKPRPSSEPSSSTARPSLPALIAGSISTTTFPPNPTPGSAGDASNAAPRPSSSTPSRGLTSTLTQELRASCGSIFSIPTILTSRPRPFLRSTRNTFTTARSPTPP